jgi:hypothetical protein
MRPLNATEGATGRDAPAPQTSKCRCDLAHGHTGTSRDAARRSGRRRSAFLFRLPGFSEGTLFAPPGVVTVRGETITAVLCLRGTVCPAVINSVREVCRGRLRACCARGSMRLASAAPAEQVAGALRDEDPHPARVGWVHAAPLALHARSHRVATVHAAGHVRLTSSHSRSAHVRHALPADEILPPDHGSSLWPFTVPSPPTGPASATRAKRRGRGRAYGGPKRCASPVAGGSAARAEARAHGRGC